MIKTLNLYANIGGNRKKWKGCDVTAIENDPYIASAYQDLFPDDEVIVCDAHDYLLNNFEKFDFIWSSPPCPTHSRLNLSNKTKSKISYPDMTLYQQIILLKSWFKGKYVVENVIPYYPSLIPPTIVLQRHFFWLNFNISSRYFERVPISQIDEKNFLSKKYGFNLDKYRGFDKRKALRNCVHPDLGDYLFESAMNKVEQKDLFI